jgi:phosphatidylinositol glycan class U
MTLPSITIPLVFSTIDIIIAYALSLITQLKQQRDAKEQKLKAERDITPILPCTVAALYLFNPLTILSCVSKSTLSFTNLSIIMALLSALKGLFFWLLLQFWEY